MCAKKKAARAIKPAGPPESPATSAEPIVMVGVFEVDEADPKYFHLLPAPDWLFRFQAPDSSKKRYCVAD